MYGSEEEIKGYKQTLDILIEKKNFLQSELTLATDASIKFSLQKQLKNLEQDIQDFRTKLNEISPNSSSDSESNQGASVSQLQQDAEKLQSEVSKLNENDASKPDLIEIHKTLTKRFNDENLNTFCMLYFDKVYDNFADGQTKTAKINALLDYARRNDLLSKLDNDLKAFLA